jgi:hypothetical protein
MVDVNINKTDLAWTSIFKGAFKTVCTCFNAHVPCIYQSSLSCQMDLDTDGIINQVLILRCVVDDVPSAAHTYCVCVCNAGRAYRFHGQRFATAEPKGTRSTDCARALNCCPVHDSGRQSQGNRSKVGGVSRNQAVRHRRRRAIAGAFRFRMCTSDS